MPWCRMCWRSVVAPAMRSMRVGAPRNDEYGVWVTATRSFPAARASRPAAGSSREQQRVGVEREHVGGVRDAEVRVLSGPLAARTQDAALGRVASSTPRATHQPMYELRFIALLASWESDGVVLALERREAREDPARRRCSFEPAPGRVGVLLERRRSGRRTGRSSRARPISTWSTKNSSTWSSIGSLSAMSRASRRPPRTRRSRVPLLAALDVGALAARRELGQRAGEACGRTLQRRLDSAGSARVVVELRAGRRVRWGGAGHRPAGRRSGRRELLQRRRPERGPHDAVVSSAYDGTSTVIACRSPAKCRSSSPRGHPYVVTEAIERTLRAIRYIRAEKVRNVTTIR